MNKSPGNGKTEKVVLRGLVNRGSERGAERSSRNSINQYRSKQNKFEYQIDALMGQIYDCTDSRQADLYTSTIKEIAGYVATALKNGNDVKSAIENLKVPVMVLPNDDIGKKGLTRSVRKRWS